METWLWEDCDLKVAESYFVDAIEEWREKMGIERYASLDIAWVGTYRFVTPKNTQKESKT